MKSSQKGVSARSISRKSPTQVNHHLPLNTPSVCLQRRIFRSVSLWCFGSRLQMKKSRHDYQNVAWHMHLPGRIPVAKLPWTARATCQCQALWRRLYLYGCHLRHHAITAGVACMNSDVVLSRLWRTKLFLRAGIENVIGPAQSPNTTCRWSLLQSRTLQFAIAKLSPSGANASSHPRVIVLFVSLLSNRMFRALLGQRTKKVLAWVFISYQARQSFHWGHTHRKIGADWMTGYWDPVHLV